MQLWSAYYLSSRFPWCVVWYLSWNKQLSRAINYYLWPSWSCYSRSSASVEDLRWGGVHPNCRAAYSFSLFLPPFKHIWWKITLYCILNKQKCLPVIIYSLSIAFGGREAFFTLTWCWTMWTGNNVNWQQCETGNTGNGIKAVVFHSGQKNFLFTCTQVDVILDGIKSCSLMLS